MIHQVGCRMDGFINPDAPGQRLGTKSVFMCLSSDPSSFMSADACTIFAEVLPFYLQSNSESFDRLKCPNLRPAFEVRSSVLLNLSFPASLPAKCFMADVEFFQWKLQMCLLLAAKPKDNDSPWSLQLHCHGTRSLQDAWNKSPTCLR